MNDTQLEILEEKRLIMKRNLDFLLAMDPGNDGYEKVVQNYMRVADSIDKSVEFNETLYEKQITTQNAEAFEREKFEQQKLIEQQKLEIELAKIEQAKKDAVRGLIWNSVLTGTGIAMYGVSSYANWNTSINGVIKSKTHQEAERNRNKIVDTVFKQIK